MNCRGDQLIARMLKGRDDVLANDLLGEFFSGYPVENLRPLLRSTDEGIAKTATWLASELGERAIPIFDAVVPMLRHGSRYVRFFAVDTVLVCATEEHGEAIARTIGLLLDGDDAVRWKALMFVAKASRGQLSASLPYQSNRELGALTSWILGLDQEGGVVANEVTSKLDDHQPLVRLFAAAAAVRFSFSVPALLKRAAESSDAEVASFASEQLKFHR